MTKSIADIFSDVLAQATVSDDNGKRIYRLLGNKAVGVRAASTTGEQIPELLIEIPPSWDGRSALPQWRGMAFDLLDLSVPPRTEARHLRLRLHSNDHLPVFVSFCEDLVSSLEEASDADTRVQLIEDCVERWRMFFDKAGTDGLSKSEQRGLFAELRWLTVALDCWDHMVSAVQAWKGGEHDYHDFDHLGHAVEVKSTLSKEPRRIMVSNERQLDDRGVPSLHLFVAILHQVDAHGTTLPERVAELRGRLSGSPLAAATFENKLLSAGYHDHHAELYELQYTTLDERAYRIVEGFPRIVDLPPGTGDLEYSVLLGSCEQFRVTVTEVVNSIRSNGNE